MKPSTVRETDLCHPAEAPDEELAVAVDSVDCCGGCPAERDGDVAAASGRGEDDHRMGPTTVKLGVIFRNEHGGEGGSDADGTNGVLYTGDNERMPVDANLDLGATTYNYKKSKMKGCSLLLCLALSLTLLTVNGRLYLGYSKADHRLLSVTNDGYAADEEAGDNQDNALKSDDGCSGAANDVNGSDKQVRCAQELTASEPEQLNSTTVIPIQRPTEYSTHNDREPNTNPSANLNGDKPSSSRSERHISRPYYTSNRPGSGGSPNRPRPNDKPNQKPNNKPNKEPNKKPDKKPNNKPDKKPNNKPDKKPDKKPNNKPDKNDKPNKKPDNKPAKKPNKKPNKSPKRMRQHVGGTVIMSIQTYNNDDDNGR